MMMCAVRQMMMVTRNVELNIQALDESSSGYGGGGYSSGGGGGYGDYGGGDGYQDDENDVELMAALALSAEMDARQREVKERVSVQPRSFLCLSLRFRSADCVVSSAFRSLTTALCLCDRRTR